jgi:hypothetical protein
MLDQETAASSHLSITQDAVLSALQLAPAPSGSSAAMAPAAAPAAAAAAALDSTALPAFANEANQRLHGQIRRVEAQMAATHAELARNVGRGDAMAAHMRALQTEIGYAEARLEGQLRELEGERHLELLLRHELVTICPSHAEDLTWLLHVLHALRLVEANTARAMRATGTGSEYCIHRTDGSFKSCMRPVGWLPGRSG